MSFSSIFKHLFDDIAAKISNLTFIISSKSCISSMYLLNKYVLWNEKVPWNWHFCNKMFIQQITSVLFLKMVIFSFVIMLQKMIKHSVILLSTIIWINHATFYITIRKLQELSLMILNFCCIMRCKNKTSIDRYFSVNNDWMLSFFSLFLVISCIVLKFILKLK